MSTGLYNTETLARDHTPTQAPILENYRKDTTAHNAGCHVSDRVRRSSAVASTGTHATSRVYFRLAVRGRVAPTTFTQTRPPREKGAATRPLPQKSAQLPSQGAQDPATAAQQPPHRRNEVKEEIELTCSRGDERRAWGARSGQPMAGWAEDIPLCCHSGSPSTRAADSSMTVLISRLIPHQS